MKRAPVRLARVLLCALLLTAAACGDKGNTRPDTKPVARPGLKKMSAEKREQLEKGGSANATAAKKFEEASALFQKMPAAAPEAASQRAKVRGLLEDAVDQDRRFGRAWFNLGVVYEQEGDTEKAKDAYAKAAKFSPKMADPHVNLGVMALKRGDRAGAIKHFQDALKANPVDPTANNNLSVLQREDRNYKDATIHARRALAGDARNVKAYANLAMVYYDRGYNDVAKLVVLNALKISEKDPDVWNIYALIELRNKNVTAAIKYLQSALDANPEYEPALMNLGSISLSVRDFDKAQKLFEAALKKDPNNAEALLSIGVIKRTMGDLKEARRLYEEVRTKHASHPASKLALFNLAVLEHEHLSQEAMVGEGNAPTNPAAQVAWNIKNMQAGVDHYRKGKALYQEFINTYKGKKTEYVTEAKQRIKNIDKSIKLVDGQVTQMKTMLEQLKAQGGGGGGAAAPAPKPAAKPAPAPPAKPAPAPKNP